VLLRLAYLGVTNALAMLRLLPTSDRAKDAEIVVLRHQLMVLERQLHGQKIRFVPADRAFLPALLNQFPRAVLQQVRLLVRPETVLHCGFATDPARVRSPPDKPRVERTVQYVQSNFFPGEEFGGAAAVRGGDKPVQVAHSRRRSSPAAYRPGRSADRPGAGVDAP
jgi:hypothetical protein